MFLERKKLIFIVAAFVISCIVMVAFVLRVRKTTQQTLLIENTSNKEVDFDNQWPLRPNNNQVNNFLVRVVLEPELITGKVELDGYLIESWNYGLFKDATGKIQRVAIPRSWYNLTQKKLFILSSAAPIYMDGYSLKFISSMVNSINENNRTKQNLVAVYFATYDPDIDQSQNSFYENFGYKLPNSFILTGDISELPKKPNIGTILPITQLVFDLEK